MHVGLDRKRAHLMEFHALHIHVRTVEDSSKQAQHLPSRSSAHDRHVDFAIANFGMRSELHTCAGELGVARHDKQKFVRYGFVIEY